MTHDLHAAYENWYGEYSWRVNDWIADCAVNDTAMIILELPDLLHLLVCLSADDRLTAEQRARVSKTANGVLRGIEYLPTDQQGVLGLISDALKIARTLEPLLPELDPAALREGWGGDWEVTALVRYLLHERGTFMPRC